MLLIDEVERDLLKRSEQAGLKTFSGLELLIPIIIDLLVEQLTGCFPEDFERVEMVLAHPRSSLFRVARRRAIRGACEVCNEGPSYADRRRLTEIVTDEVDEWDETKRHGIIRETLVGTPDSFLLI